MDWISKPDDKSGLTFDYIDEDHVLVLRPTGDLQSEDFERMSDEVDPVIQKSGGLRGLMISADHLPSWENFSALISHMRFVKKHRKEIGRIAVVSDDKAVSIAPRLLKHFVSAEVKAFLRRSPKRRCSG
ncbi:MAG: STAS/SEC14 domain-containing protein [Polyangiales bacterium]